MFRQKFILLLLILSSCTQNFDSNSKKIVPKCLKALFCCCYRDDNKHKLDLHNIPSGGEINVFKELELKTAPLNIKYFDENFVKLEEKEELKLYWDKVKQDYFVRSEIVTIDSK